MTQVLKPSQGYALAARHLLKALGNSRHWLRLDDNPHPGDVPATFFGINIAPGISPSSDDYIVARLQELQLTQVRMDFSYDSIDGPAERLLQLLLERDIGVLLNVYPPPPIGHQLVSDTAAQTQWQSFIEQLCQRYGPQLAAIELGNTPNRGKWSGLSSHAFIVAWQLAGPIIRNHGIVLAGPNVSDFEPLYNAVYLGLLQQLGNAPHIHTDNLFVERVVEPEAYDHRVLGRAATNRLRLNLIKKARALQWLGAKAGATGFYCSYTCWTIKRLQRWTPWPYQKQADYLLRYLILAASSQALDRVYWGPLICARDGLIDDGQGIASYPKIDQVSCYTAVRGDVADYRKTAGFAALQFCIKILAGARFTNIVHQPNGLSLFTLRHRDGQHYSVCWCRDGQSWPLHTVFAPETLGNAQFYDCQGQAVASCLAISESPIVIRFGEQAAAAAVVGTDQNIVHLCTPEHQSLAVSHGDWQGAWMLRRSQQQADAHYLEQLQAEQLPQLPELGVLRDSRNRIWNVAHPNPALGLVTVKLNRTKGFKKLSYYFRDSKGRRHWNNACVMLRRGIATPRPIAFYEQRGASGVADSWYLCEFIPNALSARNVYAAFNTGEQQYLGLGKAEWFDLLAGFVSKMHSQRIVHRDLSAGNLLLQQHPDGLIEPMLIDIGRTWLSPKPRLTDRQRLLDLMRICYKLPWADREQFVACYQQHSGQRLAGWWRMPFHWYDNKQRFKKWLKGK